MADVVGNAVLVARIATGEMTDSSSEKNEHAVALGKLGGKKGGDARARKLKKGQLKAIATRAANSRWKNNP